MPDVYLLDTVVASHATSPGSEHYAIVNNWMEKCKLRGDYHYISVVTKAEVEYGARIAALPKTRIDEIARGFDEFKAFKIDKYVAETYAVLRTWIFDKYGSRSDKGAIKDKRLHRVLMRQSQDEQELVTENDLWIASTAVAQNLVYVTHDSRQRRIFEAAEAVYGRMRRIVGYDDL